MAPGAKLKFFIESFDGIGGKQHRPVSRIELEKRQQGIQVFVDDLRR